MIREAIKEAMKVRNVKQKDLAEHIGIAPSTMSQFLSGKMNLGQNTIETMFLFLEIEVRLSERVSNSND